MADRTTNSAHLLTSMRAAHCEVLDCIAEMERVTATPVPDVRRYTAARFRISRASLERRSLWQCARQHLQKQVTAVDLENLRLLGSIDSKLGSDSADHVSQWTILAIQTNWPGYRAASRHIRRRMAQCIEAEKRILYPLLARYP